MILCSHRSQLHIRQSTVCKCVHIWEGIAEWWRCWNKRHPSWIHFLRRTLLAFTSLLWGLYTHSPLSSHPFTSTILLSFFILTLFPSLPFPAPSTPLATVATQILFITQHKEKDREKGENRWLASALKEVQIERNGKVCWGWRRRGVKERVNKKNSFKEGGWKSES